MFTAEVVSFMLTLGLGVGSIPWLLLGELCPVQVVFASAPFSLNALGFRCHHQTVIGKNCQRSET